MAEDGSTLIKIEAIVREEKYVEVKKVLSDIGVNGITVYQVVGCGVQRGISKRLNILAILVTERFLATILNRLLKFVLAKLVTMRCNPPQKKYNINIKLYILAMVLWF